MHKEVVDVRSGRHIRPNETIPKIIILGIDIAIKQDPANIALNTPWSPYVLIFQYILFLYFM